MKEKMNVYFISHLGLGDNITSVGAVRFLSSVYEGGVRVICKNIHCKNVVMMYADLKNVQVIAINSKLDEKKQCLSIVNNLPKHCDILVCGWHAEYIQQRISNPLMKFYQDKFSNCHSTYVTQYTFIANFYKDLRLGMEVYVDWFALPTPKSSKHLFQRARNYYSKFVFMHTQSSNRTIPFPSRELEPYVRDSKCLIVCANQNYYNFVSKNISDSQQYATRKMFAQEYVELPIVYYFDVILNAVAIFSVDSCFCCIIEPLRLRNELKHTSIHILNR